MAKTIRVNKKNPQDLTLRNLRAMKSLVQNLNRAHAQLYQRVCRLERALVELAGGPS